MIINLAKKMKLKTADKVCREDITINPLLQTKTVTGNGTVKPDAGYVGLGKVDVDVANTLSKLADDPLMPRIGNLKYYTNNRFYVQYVPMFPLKSFNSAGIFTNYGVADTIEEAESMFFGTYLNKLRHECGRFVTEDGVFRLGYNAVGVVAGFSRYGNGSAVVEQMTFPKCSIKIRYLENDGTVGEMTKELSELSVDKYQHNGTDASNTISCVRALELPFFGDGSRLIFSVEATYPKADVAFAGDAAKVGYSVDNGLNFQTASEGLVLEQMEHVVLNNAGSGTIHIGTSEGANDVCTISAVGRYVVEVTENATLYVSEEA